MSSCVPKTAVRLSENVTAKPSAGHRGNQFGGVQARKRHGIDGSSWTCFVHSSVMLGSLIDTSDTSPEESQLTWNRATDPTLLAIANRFFCFG